MFFRKKPNLKQRYDEKLLELMEQQRNQWENVKKLDEITAEADGFTKAQRKLAEIKYFYLFKEARIRQIKGRL